MSKLTKAEFVKGVASTIEGVSVKETEAFIDATFEYISEQLAAGNAVAVPKFGTFEAKERGERLGRNPKTKETITIPATVAPVFKASSTLKDKVAKK